MLPHDVPTAASIVIAALVAAIVLGIVVAALRRRRERRLIEQATGKLYHPDPAGPASNEPSEDQAAAQARERAAALGRSRRSWS
jgi:hypothetical protein